MMAIVVKGDALNPEQVQKAFDQIEEVDAVVSTIGGTPADPAADSQVPKLAPGLLFVIPAGLSMDARCCTSPFEAGIEVCVCICLRHTYLALYGCRHR